MAKFTFCGSRPVRGASLRASRRATTTEPPADVYGECLIRTATTNGIIMLTFTPLSGLSTVVLQFMPAEFRPDMSD